MYSFPIGVILESFHTTYRKALDAAAALGVQGVQVYTTSGELAPDRMTPATRKEFIHMVKDHGLQISALCGDLGRGFGNADLNPELIEKSKRIVDLAKEWETDIVTTHIGVTPDDPTHPRFKIMQDACFQLAQYADQMKAHFAIETGPETAATLKAFLDTLHSTGVAVNLDPANLVMVTGDDPVAAVHTLKDYIVHTHAKDGRMLRRVSAENVYMGTHDDALVTSPAFIELKLGDGQVPYPEYLQALWDIGYRGYLTIEREVGENPADDIRLSVDFLRNLMNR